MGAAIECGGGVVWRMGSGGLEVVLVHRPRRQDWTLPIGRLDPGETLEQCALREVAEESGHRCRLGPFLTTLEIVGADDGLVHRFHLWSMTSEAQDFQRNPETDRAEWLPLDEAIERATYPNVRELLASLPGTHLG